MASTRLIRLLLATILLIAGCSGPGAPGTPEPLVVLENPQSGERARFFKEIPFNVPADYDERKHIADWTAEQNDKGFTKPISPADDRRQLADLRARNLEASRPDAKK